MTGSSLPASASAVRSRPYFSSAWYVPLGILRSDVLPAADVLERLEQRFTWDDVEREQEVLDRGVLVAQSAHLLEGLVEHAAEARRHLRLDSLAAGFGGLSSCASSPWKRSIVAQARRRWLSWHLVEERYRQMIRRQLRINANATLVSAGDEGTATFVAAAEDLAHSLPRPPAALWFGLPPHCCLPASSTTPPGRWHACWWALPWAAASRSWRLSRPCIHDLQSAIKRWPGGIASNDDFFFFFGWRWVFFLKAGVVLLVLVSPLNHVLRMQGLAP